MDSCDADPSFPDFQNQGGDKVELIMNDDNDDLLSQAYENFMICQSKNVGNLRILSKEKGNDSDGLEDSNYESPEKNYLEDQLITLEDLLDPVSSFVAQQDPDLQLLNLLNIDKDNDLSEASTISTIIVMEIFNNAVESTTLNVSHIVENIFIRAWRMIKPRSRWRVPDPASWKGNVARKRRADGLPYVTKKVCRKPKVPKPVDCNKCQFKCNSNFTNEDRSKLCRSYWNQDYAGKKNFILSLIEVQPIRTFLLNRKRSTPRTNTKKYFFCKNEQKMQVCQNFFCKTFCISPAVITEAVSKRNSEGVYEATFDPRGHKTPPNQTPSEILLEVRQHIESFPTMASHYVRKDIQRKYLDCKLSIRKMYALYLEQCKEKESTVVSEAVYCKIFSTEFNLGFFVPKKDQCLLCTKYQRLVPENIGSLENEYKEHIARKEACNNEKKKDKERACNDKKFISATFDLQAILQIPTDQVSILYYCRKLMVYNLTIYESAPPNEAYCFAWSEANGKKGSAEIGSILYIYLSQYVPKNVNKVAIFSDTCGGQNRNQYVASLLLWAVQKIDNLNTIEHKFLESGHSYMEVDSMHSSIESAQKHSKIYSMSEWLNVFRRARSSRSKKNKTMPKPYNTKELKYNDFLDLKTLAGIIMKHKNKNTEGDRVNWLKIKRMKYEKGQMKILYNYDMSENFLVLDLEIQETNVEATPTAGSDIPAHRYGTRHKKAVANSAAATTNAIEDPTKASLPTKLNQLYNAPLPITNAQKSDLLKLCTKGVIPEEYHAWFENLATDSTKLDRVPDATVSDVSSDEE